GVTLPVDSGGQVPPLALADVNGDNHLDVLTAGSFVQETGTSQLVAVLFGSGDGRLSAPVTFFAGAAPILGAVAALDRDQHLDLAALTSAGIISVLHGTGTASVFMVQPDYASGVNPNTLALGDINGDRVPDLVLAQLAFTFGNQGALSILVGNGDGS